MKLEIERHSEVVRSVRVQQLEGLFDVAPASRSGERWAVDLPIETRPWAVGLIVGPSGCGKSTIAREVFGAAVCQGFDWPERESIVDAFPAAMGIKEITGLLSSVGFSSPPLWLRPFGALSTGQQMRVTAARLLAEEPALAVMDEFTSVVDRTVAQVGSAAIAKAVRKRGQQFVAVTCHNDVEEWLQPDWVYRPDSGAFAWREVRRRPPMDIAIQRVEYQAWHIFKKYHYLDAHLHRSARCWCAFYRDVPVALCAVLPMPNSHGGKANWRISRIVTDPDYQGCGVGLTLMNTVASMFRATTGSHVFIATGLPALESALMRSKQWAMERKPAMGKRPGRTSNGGFEKSTATTRMTASFRYSGPAMPRPEAQRLMADRR